MQRTPGMYTAINTQTQRTGLPNQNHSIVFVTSDVGAPATPTPIYDTSSADAVSGADSNAGRMMAAALSISQGVRVDTVGKLQPSDGSGGSDGSIDLSFLKLEQKILGQQVDMTGKIGMAYSINNGPINPLFFENPDEDGAFPSRDTVAVFARSAVAPHIIGMGNDLFGHGGVELPAPLDIAAAYIFGGNDALFKAEFQRNGYPVPDGFFVDETPLEITFYPATTQSLVNIDHDIFSLIIDPADYTAADLQYFVDRGVTPAVKNPDGSYTIKSKMTLPAMG